MAALYDLVIMLDPAAAEEQRHRILETVESMIRSTGTLVGNHDWGNRRMAYEIDHRPDAAYHILQFESGNDVLDRLNHTLKITDGVIRYRIIKLKPGSPAPPSPRPEARPESRSREDGDSPVAPRAAADARR